MAYPQSEFTPGEVSDSSEPIVSDIGLRYHLASLIHRFELTPLRVSLLYLVFGITALYVSDVFLVRVLEEPLLSQAQAVKGFLEVVVTAGLIFGLTTGSRVPVQLQNERLERQQEELQVLHRLLRHNLRNNLNTILGYTDLINQRAGNRQREDWYNGIHRCVDRLLHSTEQASMVNKISSHGGEHAAIDLSTMVPRLVEDHDRVDDTTHVTVDIPNNVEVQAHRMLDVAVEELLTNAIEYNDSAEPEVMISVEPGGGLVSETRIQIEDDGPGLPDHAVTVLEQTQEDRLVHLEGLGLWMAHWIAVESHGQLDVETGDWGTRVTLTVPSAFEMPTMAPEMATG